MSSGLGQLLPQTFAWQQLFLSQQRQVGQMQDIFSDQDLDQVFNHPDQFVIKAIEEFGIGRETKK